MRADTTPKMIAQSALTATLEHIGTIIESITPVGEDLLGRGEFSITLKNGRTYRFTVAESAVPVPNPETGQSAYPAMTTDGWPVESDGTVRR